jgi:hypothetical protein
MRRTSEGKGNHQTRGLSLRDVLPAPRNVGWSRGPQGPGLRWIQRSVATGCVPAGSDHRFAYRRRGPTARMGRAVRR